MFVTRAWLQSLASHHSPYIQPIMQRDISTRHLAVRRLRSASRNGGSFINKVLRKYQGHEELESPFARARAWPHTGNEPSKSIGAARGPEATLLPLVALKNKVKRKRNATGPPFVSALCYMQSAR